jgi:hypothetical protein
VFKHLAGFEQTDENQRLRFRGRSTKEGFITPLEAIPLYSDLVNLFGQKTPLCGHIIVVQLTFLT